MSTRTYSNDLTKMPKRFYTHLNNSPFKHFEKKSIELIPIYRGEITLKIEYLCGNSKITTDKG